MQKRPEKNKEKNKEKNGVTLKMIADKVGVSVTTVSRILNFDHTLSVSDEVHQKVIETAEAMNYQTPRRRQGKMSPSKTHSIAILHWKKPHEELDDPYYVGLRLGIEKRCSELGVVPITHYYDGSPETLNKTADAAGVITIGWFEPSQLDEIANMHPNMVLADHESARDAFDSVGCDLYRVTYNALKKLYKLNYNKIGMVSLDCRPSHVRGYEERAAAYVDWSKNEQNSGAELLKVCSNSEDDGYEQAKELLAAKIRPDLIMTGTDNIAIGVYRAVEDAGLSIPKDVAVCGFNDIAVARFMTPPLTTVRLPARTIGRTAVDLLEEQIQGRAVGKRVFVQCEMIWRDSTRKEEDISGD